MDSVELSISEWLAQPISVERNNRLSVQFADWARHDSGAAIKAVGEISDSATRRTIALALFNALGREASIADALADALPQIDSTTFRIETIAEIAKSDPIGAIGSALLLPTQSQRDLAFRRMLPAIVRSDPEAILATLDNLGVRPNIEFRAKIVESWAELDPQKFIRYLETSDKHSLPDSARAYEIVAVSHPELMLSLVGDFPPYMRNAIRSVALDSLISSDPLSAVNYIDTIPPGAERQRLTQAFAESFGSREPGAAQTWAYTQWPRSPEMLIGVLNGIQSVDRNRAWQIVRSELEHFDAHRRAAMQVGINSFLSHIASSGPSTEISHALNEVVTMGNVVNADVLQRTITSWAAREPEDALSWSLNNRDRVPDSLFGEIGSALASENSDLAYELAGDLPESARPHWIAAVSRAMAWKDLNSARSKVLALPAGEVRDSALREYLSIELEGGSVSLEVFSAFSNDRVREDTAYRFASRLACRGDARLAIEISSSIIRDADRRAEISHSTSELTSGSGARACP